MANNTEWDFSGLGTETENINNTEWDFSGLGATSTDDQSTTPKKKSKKVNTVVKVAKTVAKNLPFAPVNVLMNALETKDYIEDKLGSSVSKFVTDNTDTSVSEKKTYSTPKEQIDAVYNNQTSDLKKGILPLGADGYTSLGLAQSEKLAKENPDKYGNLSFSNVKLPYDLIIQNHEKEQLAMDEINSGERQPTIGEVVKEGVKSSIPGLINESYDYFPTMPGYTEEVLNQLPVWKRAAYNMSTLATDLPVYATSSVLTTPTELVGGPTLHGAMTFAIPGMMRRHYSTLIERGDADNWQDYWDNYIKPDLQTGAKEGVIGAITFGVDKYTGGITTKYAEKLGEKYAEKMITRKAIGAIGGTVRLAASDTAMTLTGDLLYQQAPTWKQFVDNGIVLTFLHGQNKLVGKTISGINKKVLYSKVKKLIDVYARGNFLTLDEINKQFQKNPKAFDDFMSADIDIPDIFKVDPERKVIELKINADEVKARKNEVSKANQQVTDTFNKFVEELNKKTTNTDEHKSNTESINNSILKLMDTDLDTTIKSAEDYYYGIGLLEPDAAKTDIGKMIVNNTAHLENYKSLVDDIKTTRTKIKDIMEQENEIDINDPKLNDKLDEIKTRKRNLIVILKSKYKQLMPEIKEMKILEGMKDKLIGLDKSSSAIKEYRYSLGDPFILLAGTNEKENPVHTEYASSKEELLKQLKRKGIDTSKIYMLYEASIDSSYLKDVLNDTILKSYIDRNTFNDIYKPKEKSKNPNEEIKNKIASSRNASVQEKTIVDNFKDWIDEMKSAWKKVPNSIENADIRFKAYLLDHMGKIKAEEVISHLDKIYDNLGEDQKELFELKILIEDELETIKRNEKEAKKENDKGDQFNKRPKVQTHLTEWFSGKGIEDVELFKQWIDEEIEKFNTTENNGNVINKIKDAVAADKKYMDTIRSAVIESYKTLGIDITKRYGRDAYFTHHTISHAKDTYRGRGLKTGTNRSYFKQRSEYGTTAPYETNYRISRYEIAHALLMDVEMNKLKLFVKETYSDPRLSVLKEEYKKVWEDDIYQRIDKLKKEIDKLNKNSDINNPKMEDIVDLASKKEELTNLVHKINGGWKQFIDKNKERISSLSDIKTTYSAYDKAIIDKINEDLKQCSEKDKPILVGKMISLKDEIVLPNNIADMVDTIGNVYVKSNPWTKALGLWKEYQLFNPITAIKYNFRNFEGDFEAVIAGNPHTTLMIPQAIKELLAARKGEISDTLKTFKERGADISTLQEQEFHDIEHKDVAKYFKDLEEGKKDNIAKTYFKFVEDKSNFREMVLRYATYLSYLKQIEESPVGAPENIGASKADEIMGLTNKYDRSYLLTDELIGAYDRISTFGTWARRNIIPFYSWTEVNATRSYRLIRNALMQTKDMERLGVKILSKNKFTRGLKISGVMAMKVGQYVLSGAGIQTFIQVFNNTIFRDEEKDLPENVRNSFHIIFGRDENNEVSYFGNLGAFNDLLQWVNMQSLPNKVITYMINGMNIEDAVCKWYADDFTLKEIGKAASNKLIQGTTPYIKTPVELITGKQFYPDIYNPKTIHDRPAYVFKSLRLEDEYKHIANLLGAHYPVQDYFTLDKLSRLFIYKADTYQSGYYDTLDLIKKYKKEIGEPYDFTMTSPKGEALYNYRLSLIYGDEDAEAYWKEQYVENGGKVKDINKSESLHPLNGLTKAQKADFKSRLDDDEWNKYEQALIYYNALKNSDMEELKNAEPTGIHKYIKKIFQDTESEDQPVEENK